MNNIMIGTMYPVHVQYKNMVFEICANGNVLTNALEESRELLSASLAYALEKNNGFLTELLSSSNEIISDIDKFLKEHPTQYADFKLKILNDMNVELAKNSIRIDSLDLNVNFTPQSISRLESLNPSTNSIPVNIANTVNDVNTVNVVTDVNTINTPVNTIGMPVSNMSVSNGKSSVSFFAKIIKPLVVLIVIGALLVGAKMFLSGSSDEKPSSNNAQLSEKNENDVENEIEKDEDIENKPKQFVTVGTPQPIYMNYKGLVVSIVARAGIVIYSDEDHADIISSLFISALSNNINYIEEELSKNDEIIIDINPYLNDHYVYSVLAGNMRDEMNEKLVNDDFEINYFDFIVIEFTEETKDILSSMNK